MNDRSYSSRRSRIWFTMFHIYYQSILFPSLLFLLLLFISYLPCLPFRLSFSSPSPNFPPPFASFSPTSRTLCTIYLVSPARLSFLPTLPYWLSFAFFESSFFAPFLDPQAWPSQFQVEFKHMFVVAVYFSFNFSPSIFVIFAEIRPSSTVFFFFQLVLSLISSFQTDRKSGISL